MKNNITDTGKIIALLSFVIGTIFLSLYLYYGESVVNIYLAFLFIILAVITNTVMIAIIIGSSLLKKTNRLEGFKTVIVILLNIPIAILYFYMVITFPGHRFLI